MAALNTHGLLVASFLVLGLLHLESAAQTAHDLDCCYNYTKKELKLKVIISYTNQSSSDVCDIDAIIFHTKKKFNVCADPEEPWVKRILKALSRRNKKGQKKQASGKSRKGKGGRRKQG